MRMSVARLGAAGLAMVMSVGLGIGTASSAHATDFLSYCKTFSPYESELWQGMDTGDGIWSEIQALQCELNVWGDFGLAVDGRFGQHTHDAVVDFQKRVGLDPDGVVGWYTWHALDYWVNHKDA